MTSKIIATGSFVPDDPVNNQFLSTLVDTSDEWIQSRTGIKTRYITRLEGTTKLAYEAAKDALSSEGINPMSLDYIIVATMSPDYSLPNTASQVQAFLGAKNAASFDLNVACSGFVYALTVANALVSNGKKKRALVIGAETVSRMLDWSDRSTCVLFGDGAGAVVVETAEKGIIHSILGTDGENGMALACPSLPLQNPFIDKGQERAVMSMDGQKVFKFAVSMVSKSIEQLLEETNKEKDEIAGYYLHQANYRIIEAIARRLKIDQARFPMNVDKYANTSAASIPMLLNEQNRKHAIQPGDLIVLAGFGGGLTYGTMLLEW